MVFPVVMYGWESWTIETWVQESWCFWTVVLEKTLESPLAARRSSQSILKQISPRCSLEGLMLNLKLQYFGHLMQRVDSLEKTLMLGKFEGRKKGDNRGWDGWMASPTQCTWVWVDSCSWWWTGRPGILKFMGLQRVRHDWVTELNWTELKSPQSCLTLFNPMDHSPPGSSVHGILQTRILEWVGMPSWRRSSRPRHQTLLSYVSCISRWLLYH